MMQHSSLPSIIDFYAPYRAALFDDAVFREHLLRCPFVSRARDWDDERFFYEVLDSYLDEAKHTLSIIQNRLISHSGTMLEVGAGLGLVYCFLQKQEYDIYGIEPCDSGFDGFYHAAIALCAVLHADARKFHPLTAEDVGSLNISFSLIFSNNVLEHIPRLEESLISLKKVLADDGVMIHHTVNYLVPYEPHYKMPLIPFFPRATEFFKPALLQFALWKGLNFITTRTLKRISHRIGLDIFFHHGMVRHAFMRFETDRIFAQRQKKFLPLYRLLSFFHLLPLLDWIPIACTSPITFTLTKKEHGALHDHH